MITKVDLSDSGSGFYMIRRDAVEEIAPRLSSQGFKLLLDIMTTARGTLRAAELPYGDSFHDVGNMQGPGEEAGARGLGPTLYLFDPNGHLVELRHY